MPSDYRVITQRNEARLGTDTSSRKTQISIYANSTQFVYELLQNADDCGATEISFNLLGDAIVIEHNGKPFTEADVEGITYFGTGTNREDFIKTERFGIGFKSVFAFTGTPIIISDDEHFKIYNLYRVRKYPCPDGFPRSCTRIVLPFNHNSECPVFVEEQMSPENAYQRIKKSLITADISTLMFTRSIQKIDWKIYSSATRYIQKIRRTDEFVYIDAGEQLVADVVEIFPTNSGSLEKRQMEQDGNRIKVYGSSVSEVHDYLRFDKVISVKDENSSISKDYRVSVAFGMKQQHNEWKITPLEPSQVFIYFPAAKEISGLRFHLQAPFVSTASRDSLQDCPMNNELRDGLADLVAESMHAIREKGLLNVEFLAVLPSGKDGLPPFYQPIMERLVKEFNREKLVSMKRGGYAAASECYRGSRNSKDLSNLINDKDMAILLGKRERVSAKILQLISRHDLLTAAEEQALVHDSSDESKKRLIESNLRLVVSLVHQFSESGVDADDLFYKGVKGLKKAVNDYVSSDGKLSSFAGRYIRETIQDYIDANRCSVNAPMKYPSLWIKNPRSNSRGDDFLSMLEISEWTIDDFIEKLNTQSKMVMNWLKEKPERWYIELYELLGYFLSKKPLSRGRKVANFISSDFKLFFKSFSLSNTDVLIAKAELIWQTMDFLNRHCSSIFVEELKDEKWVPQVMNGETTFVQPCDASFDNLPKSWECKIGQEWHKAVGFGIVAKEREEQEAKLAEDIDKICHEQKISRAELIAKLKDPDPTDDTQTEASSIKGLRLKPPFPEMPTTHSKRWETRFTEELRGVPLIEYERRVGSICVDIATEYTRAWLRANYKNDDGRMVCQICELEMPFKRRNGEYHFEAVAAFTKAYFATVDHESLYLALCPICAAAYREFVWQDQDAMANLVKQLVESDHFKIPLLLGELNTSFRFVEWHWQAIKKILKNEVKALHKPIK